MEIATSDSPQYHCRKGRAFGVTLISYKLSVLPAYDLSIARGACYGENKELCTARR